jgi:hypothetical protein
VLKPAIIKYFSLLSVLTAISFWQPSVRAQTQILQNDEIFVVYEPRLKAAADEVLRIYPLLRKDLEGFLGWHLSTRPQVVLVKANQTFQKMARNGLIVAFAVPDQNLIVIDYSRMSTRPFNLSITLKHELCHLLLHEHINAGNLPKWLDEGVCQWASDGIGEIMIDKSWSGLDAAILADQTLRLARLEQRFPRRRALLMLAYEQSKSVIFFMDRQYGRQAILNLLEDLKNEAAFETALFQNLSLSIDQLESEWLNHIERTPRWLVFFANNIYGILFFLTAVLSIVGFVRMILRKKAYAKMEDDE